MWACYVKKEFTGSNDAARALRQRHDWNANNVRTLVCNFVYSSARAIRLGASQDFRALKMVSLYTSEWRGFVLLCLYW